MIVDRRPLTVDRCFLLVALEVFWSVGVSVLCIGWYEMVSFRVYIAFGCIRLHLVAIACSFVVKEHFFAFPLDWIRSEFVIMIRHTINAGNIIMVYDSIFPFSVCISSFPSHEVGKVVRFLFV